MNAWLAFFFGAWVWCPLGALLFSCLVAAHDSDDEPFEGPQRRLSENDDDLALYGIGSDSRPDIIPIRRNGR